MKFSNTLPRNWAQGPKLQANLLEHIRRKYRRSKSSGRTLLPGGSRRGWRRRRRCSCRDSSALTRSASSSRRRSDRSCCSAWCCSWGWCTACRRPWWCPWCRRHSSRSSWSRDRWSWRSGYWRQILKVSSTLIHHKCVLNGIIFTFPLLFTNFVF